MDKDKYKYANWKRDTLEKVLNIFKQNSTTLLHKQFIRQKSNLHLYQVEEVLKWCIGQGIIAEEKTPDMTYYKWVGEFNQETSACVQVQEE